MYMKKKKICTDTPSNLDVGKCIKFYDGVAA